MLKIGSIHWKGKCSKHPRYDPKIDGLGGVRGGCKRCELLLEIYNEHAKLVRLIRTFGAGREDRKPDEPAAGVQLSLLDLN
jgi:hypothetical protein